MRLQCMKNTILTYLRGTFNTLDLSFSEILHVPEGYAVVAVEEAAGGDTNSIFTDEGSD